MTFLIPPIIFLFDTFLYQLCEAPFMYGVIGCYSILLLRTPIPYPALITALVLSGLEGFLVYGRYGANFLIFLPLTLLGLSIRKHLASDLWITLGFAGLAILLQAYALPLLIW